MQIFTYSKRDNRCIIYCMKFLQGGNLKYERERKMKNHKVLWTKSKAKKEI